MWRPFWLMGRRIWGWQFSSDVIAEFSHPEIYAPVDLNIGNCRMVVACSAEQAGTEDPKSWSHLRVATKYPFADKAIFC